MSVFTFPLEYGSCLAEILFRSEELASAEFRSCPDFIKSQFDNRRINIPAMFQIEGFSRLQGLVKILFEIRRTHLLP